MISVPFLFCYSWKGYQVKKIDNFDIYFVDFKSEQSLMKGRHPAITINDANNEGIIVIPLTSSESNFNKNNKYSVSLESGGYARIDKFEKIANESSNILYKSKRIDISVDEKKKIMSAFEIYMQETVQINARKFFPHFAEIGNEIKEGETLTFKEKVENFNAKKQQWEEIGERIIVAKVLAIDASKNSLTSAILVPIKGSGTKIADVLNEKLISRTIDDLKLGLSNSIQNSKKVNFEF